MEVHLKGPVESIYISSDGDLIVKLSVSITLQLREF